MARRADTATRARRLLALLPMLRRGERIALADLAAAVGCTVEDVAADLTTLTFCGVPPFSPLDMIELGIDGDSVTVYMDPPGLDRPVRLTAGEARALGAALEAAGFAPGSPLRAKLADACAASVMPDELERTVRASTSAGGMASLYAMLAAAVEERMKVRLSYYTGWSGTLSERVVHPWALVQRRGAWYLVGLCETVADRRVFRLDRVHEVERLDEAFEPPALVPGDVTPDIDELPVAAVRFAEDATLPDVRAWPGMAVEPSGDGVVVRVPYQSVTWIARRVTAYLGRAEVLEPAEVRMAVRHLAEDALGEL